MEYSTIIYEKKDRIAKITLNRPEVLNAVNDAVRLELIQALDDIEKGGEVDVLIITGAGRAFCAGWDLKETLAALHEKRERKGLEVVERFRNLAIPLICAVNGHAITGGLELALACDIIVASENAMFGDTHARAGLIPSGGMTQLLPRRIGVNKAKEIALASKYIPAQEAYQFGLVNRVVPLAELLPTAEAIARDILNCDQAAVRKIKYLIKEGMNHSLEMGLVLEALEHRRWRENRPVSPEMVEESRRRVLEKGRGQIKEKK